MKEIHQRAYSFLVDAKRVCRLCHKPSRRAVCETCRKVFRLFTDRQAKGVEGSPSWLTELRRRTFQS